ncbi:hypothetical protein AB0I28_06305 [Phytomonospora sp. NPDC050363]|uniref:hypothetical protein n=1 Tax=Phytomonospora sp. NPDC050363 TaxID=3155642 RepID=UPI0033C7C09A
MLRILSFLALGFLTGGAILNGVTGDPDFLWIWVTALPVTIILGSFAPVARSVRVTVKPSAGDSAKALAEGRAALARVTRVVRTAASVENVPFCRVGLVIAPRDRAPYETVIRTPVDMFAMARYQPGTPVVVGRHSLDRPDVWIIDTPDTTWRNALEESGETVPTSAPVWKPDPGTAPGAFGIGPRALPLRLAVFALAFAVGLGGPIAVNWDQLTSSTGDFVREEGAQDAVDALIEVMGDSQVVDLSLFGDFVLTTAPTTPGAVTADDFQYRYGAAERTGPTMIQPEDLAAELFDLHELDLGLIPSLTAAAERATGITGDDSAAVLISRGTAMSTEFETTPGPIEISVSLSDEYFHGSYVTDVTGAVLRMWGGHPDSDAYKAEHADD